MHAHLQAGLKSLGPIAGEEIPPGLHWVCAADLRPTQHALLDKPDGKSFGHLARAQQTHTLVESHWARFHGCSGIGASHG